MLNFLVPALTKLAQSAVPAGSGGAITPQGTNWEIAADRVSVLAMVVEAAGPLFCPHALATSNNLLRPLLSAPGIPVAMKLVALRALGSVLASAGPPTSSGEGAVLFPIWKE